MGYSLVWVAHALLNQTNSKWTWVAHANLGQTITNGLGMLFSLGCSSCFGSKQYKKNMGCLYQFGSNQYKWTWVALQHGYLKLFWLKTIQKEHGLLFSVGCSSYFGSNQYKFSMGCSSVWVTHAYLGKTSTNGHGLLFSVGYSCPFGSNQHKWTWVALQCGLLMPILVKPAQMDMGCSSVRVAHAYLGQTSMNGYVMGCSAVWVTHAILVQNHTKVHGLLFSVGYSYPFGSKQYQKDMGCSSVWVAQAFLGQTITKRMWVALQCRLLMSKYTFM